MVVAIAVALPATAESHSYRNKGTTAVHRLLVHREHTNDLRKTQCRPRYKYHYSARELLTLPLDAIQWRWRNWQRRHKWTQSLGSRCSPVDVGRRLAAKRGWTGNEWRALRTLWMHESGWNPWARNPRSGACGIPQFVPCRLYGTVRPAIRAGLLYIRGRYGSPSRALAHFYAYNWY